jgi:transcriptional regulator with XRE-family HTH domain
LTISVGRIYSRRPGSQDPTGGQIEEAELSTQGRTGKRSSSVTLRDVAKDSGVSITTVSRILNGRASGLPIRDETR